LDMLAKKSTIPKMSPAVEISQLECQVQVESHLTGGDFLTTPSTVFNKMKSIMGFPRPP
jgi:hypothetical protein